ncbi:mitogen-activated protein kinase, putative [Leishmania donovani]|uniref:cyclin-dependent kinase n=1 Tax=Leishmania donovani TaxID=5661 RepID=A0A3Q8ILL0_LEIDO|nr:mitogen-activated protein kinase, putative [Leishmania donovani]AYU81895.1 mitogen-activated protein kinase, putative [Leishmania donovani]TPP43847.1 Protein kinase domain family protein [Leishmania donovani]CBZ37073.1 mitogen-activated protein kinase, putative [Leishmania donovani]
MEAYEILGILGEGTYGVVVKARSRVTGKLVAIKRFKQTEQDEHVRKTSSREVRMLQLLQHPNVIRLEDVFRREGKLYLVFEFIDQTILQLLESTTRGLHRRELRRYTYQLLRGIEFCHNHNVIHRDVKPENVLIDESGLLKLCDFGFARQTSAKGKYTDYVATRWYRAPELLVGDVAYGKPVDVWALGCMFAELSDGQPLFPGESDLDQLCLIMQTCGPVPQRLVFIFMHNPLYNGISFPHTDILYTLKERYHRESNDWLEFLSSCLHTDPAQRLTCTELMELPYFTRDGFRDRYEAELRAATGLPQLRSTPTTSAPSTQRRAPDQAVALGGDLKADTVVSPHERRSSEIISPKLQGEQPPTVKNSSSDTHISKTALKPAAHDANAGKGKGAGAPTFTLTSPHKAASEHPVQLPMILNSNSERAVAAALTDYLNQMPASSSAVVSTPLQATPAEVAGGFTNADLLSRSCGAVPPPQTSQITNPSTTRDKNRKRNVGLAETELHRPSSASISDDTEYAATIDSSKGEPAKHISDHPRASATLPPNGVLGSGGSHEPTREGEKTNASPPLPSHGVAESSMRVLLTTAAPGKDDGETAVLSHRPLKPASADKAAATAATAFSSPTLAATHGAPLAECLQGLPALSLHLPRHLQQERQTPVAEQPQSHTPLSAETSISSFHVCRRNPLAAASTENDDVSRGKANIEPAGSSVANPRRGLSNSSVSTAASETKKRKSARHKRDTSRLHDQAVGPVSGSASRRSVPGNASDVVAYRAGFASVVNSLKSTVSQSLSYILGQQQRQPLLSPDSRGVHAADPHLHGVGAGPSVPDSTHNRNADAAGPQLRKERRSKPLAASTHALQGSDQRHRQQSQPRLDGPLHPDGGASQRATATLMALSALRNVSLPPPTKSAGDADKSSYGHHTRSHTNNNGGETVSPVVGGDGNGTQTCIASRARRPIAVCAVHGNNRDSDELISTRRVQKKNAVATHGRTGNGAVGPISCTDSSTTSSYQATSIMYGAPYHPFTRASKMDGEVGGAPQRQTLRRPKKKIADSRGSGIANITSSIGPRHSLARARQIQHQPQLAKEDGGSGDGKTPQFNAAAAASPYTSS